jgi:hypothetical protein
LYSRITTIHEDLTVEALYTKVADLATPIKVVITARGGRTTRQAFTTTLSREDITTREEITQVTIIETIHLLAIKVALIVVVTQAAVTSLAAIGIDPDRI